jgi:hypothetical protein
MPDFMQLLFLHFFFALQTPAICNKKVENLAVFH